MLALKNEHLILSFLAITLLSLLLLYFSNETDQQNESSYERSIDLMAEQVRENCIIKERMTPVTR